MEENQPQNTLRETLSANIEALESTPVAEPNVVEPTETSRSRDESGRFKAKEEQALETLQAEVSTSEPAIQRPTTWKKDYLPIWDKLSSGAALTPEEAKKLAAYSNQRENEYKSGVSTYRAEAESAKNLQEAIAPFLPTLQQNNIQPAQWIKNLGYAHQTLALGTPEQKIQMFSRLAQEYGIPLGAISQGQQGQLDPIVPQLMQQMQDLSGKVNTVTNWREQQEQQALQQQIAKFQNAEDYPHFEQVREKMAGLLQAGLAQDLDSAYKQAVRLDDDVWQAEQDRQSHGQDAERKRKAAEQVQKARSQTVSTKSATPSGIAQTGGKGLRDVLEANFASLTSGRV